jgi:hypothetical protein
MKHTSNHTVATSIGIALVWLVGFPPATHVTESTTTRQCDTTNPPIHPVCVAPGTMRFAITPNRAVLC